MKKIIIFSFLGFAAIPQNGWSFGACPTVKVYCHNGAETKLDYARTSGWLTKKNQGKILEPRKPLKMSGKFSFRQNDAKTIERLVEENVIIEDYPELKHPTAEGCYPMLENVNYPLKHVFTMCQGIKTSEDYEKEIYSGVKKIEPIYRLSSTTHRSSTRHHSTTRSHRA